MRTKMRKVRPKTGLQHVHLLHNNAPAHKSSTVAQILNIKEGNDYLTSSVQDTKGKEGRT